MCTHLRTRDIVCNNFPFCMMLEKAYSEHYSLL